MVYYFQIGKWGKRRITMKTKFGIVGCGFLGNIVADAWKNGLLELEQADTSSLFVPKKSRSF